MARLKNTGLFHVLEFPLLREGDGTEVERCTWKAKYPTEEAIDVKRNELGDIGFRREMLLQVVPEQGQDVFPEDIHYYDDPPFDDGNHLAHGVDLAISTKESADYTAIVSGEVTCSRERSPTPGCCASLATSMISPPGDASSTRSSAAATPAGQCHRQRDREHPVAALQGPRQ